MGYALKQAPKGRRSDIKTLVVIWTWLNAAFFSCTFVVLRVESCLLADLAKPGPPGIDALDRGEPGAPWEASIHVFRIMNLARILPKQTHLFNVMFLSAR